MPAVHQFAYGPLNPIAGYLMACIGSLIGLAAAAQAREATSKQRRIPWLATASITIGAGIWLMHFVAMLGFDIPSVPVRYDPLMLCFSAVLAILVVGLGIFIAGYGPMSRGRMTVGGAFTGGGIAAMYFTGMAAMRLPGSIGYNLPIAALSVLLAVLAATVALWLTITVDGWWPRCLAAAIMAAAVTGMHYTGMAALRVHLSAGTAPVRGIEPIMLVLPITIVAAAALIGLVFTALQAATQEELVPVHKAQLRRSRGKRAERVPGERAAGEYVPGDADWLGRLVAKPVPVSTGAGQSFTPNRAGVPRPGTVAEPEAPGATAATQGQPAGTPSRATGAVHVGQLIAPPRYAGTVRRGQPGGTRPE